MHLQFKFTFSRKIQVNIKNLKNISKSHRKVLNWNMYFKVLYKCHGKNLKTKIKILAEYRNWHSQRNLFAECQACSTQQRHNVCRVLTASTRQGMTEGPPASPEVFCRGLFFALLRREGFGLKSFGSEIVEGKKMLFHTFFKKF